MDKFFNPKSVAIIGASEKLRFGYFVTRSILSRSDMRSYPVNPNAGTVMDVKAYRSVAEIPEIVDLAIFLIPSDAALQTMRECAEKGVKRVIILSSGFSESDQIGGERQDAMRAIAREHGMRVIGPNCVGVTNMENGFTTAEIPVGRMTRGSLAFIAQSGIFGTAIIDWLTANKFGVSKVATLGNKMDVDEIDVMRYLENDSETGVIGIYLEGIREGRGPAFMETFKRVTARKPVLILKSGRTEAGAGAVMSHTGTMAGDDLVFDAVVRQTGAIRADGIEDLLDYARVLTKQPLPRADGVAIITNSGSLGSMACDELQRQGIRLAQFEPRTLEKMESIAPSWTSVKNPVDIGPAMLMIGKQILELVLQDKNTGCLLLISSVPGIIFTKDGLGLDLVPFYEEYREIMKRYPEKTIIVSSFGDPDMVGAGMEVFDRSGIPLITSVQSAARAIACLYRYRRYRERPR